MGTRGEGGEVAMIKVEMVGERFGQSESLYREK